ncbi:hypothetical protein Nepgr_023083 [Nepenthes gracilis]|uniref:Uncharacterized protein n=1 Tax=Nepenthes gracilis TaxID=150966 RepID=A0AAD3XZ13_NEPGR|nr:hypothetical protein Nepgr_023083 [Nepenthes gracilis]
MGGVCHPRAAAEMHPKFLMEEVQQGGCCVAALWEVHRDFDANCICFVLYCWMRLGPGVKVSVVLVLLCSTVEDGLLGLGLWSILASICLRIALYLSAEWASTSAGVCWSPVGHALGLHCGNSEWKLHFLLNYILILDDFVELRGYKCDGICRFVPLVCYGSAAKIGLLKQECSGLRWLDSVVNEWSLVGPGGLLDGAFMLLIFLRSCPVVG